MKFLQLLLLLDSFPSTTTKCVRKKPVSAGSLEVSPHCPIVSCLSFVHFAFLHILHILRILHSLHILHSLYILNILNIFDRAGSEEVSPLCQMVSCRSFTTVHRKHNNLTDFHHRLCDSSSFNGSRRPNHCELSLPFHHELHLHLRCPLVQNTFSFQPPD